MKTATWNVHSMSDGKIEVVERGMVRNNIKVVGVSELWWLGQGRFTTDNENMFIFSGKESGGSEEELDSSLNRKQLNVSWDMIHSVRK